MSEKWYVALHRLRLQAVFSEYKNGPQEKFCNNYPPCREVWASGKKVVKFIGYDAGEHYRSDKVLLRDLADPKYSKWYPLMEWGWDREACVRAIEAAGCCSREVLLLFLPVKFSGLMERVLASDSLDRLPMFMSRPLNG